MTFRRALPLLWFMASAAIAGEDPSSPSAEGPGSVPLFPELLDRAPELPSPWVGEDGGEYVTGRTRDGLYFLVEATIENGETLDYRSGQWWGKGRQLEVDSTDFPALARVGLHAEEELRRVRTITGLPVVEITRSGQPGASSSAGFMSAEEDIVSVLRGDNRIVGRMGVTHPQLSRPLFHVFNLILAVGTDSERGNVAGMLYGGREIELAFRGHKGWQESIFDDEILGYWKIEIRRQLDREERELLRRRYSHLTGEEMAEPTQKLTHIHTGEMVPFYIMRYGFYEGHTSYRADPLAIACIFGVKSLPEIESAFEAACTRC